MTMYQAIKVHPTRGLNLISIGAMKITLLDHVSMESKRNNILKAWIRPYKKMDELRPMRPKMGRTASNNNNPTAFGPGQ